MPASKMPSWLPASWRRWLRLRPASSSAAWCARHWCFLATALSQQSQATQTLAQDVSDIAQRAQQQAAQARNASASAQELAGMANTITGQLSRFSLR